MGIIARAKKVTIVVVIIIEIMALQFFLSGCGFQPRGNGYESVAGQEVILVSENPFGLLERKIKSALRASGVGFSGASSEVEDINSTNGKNSSGSADDAEALDKNIIRILQKNLIRKVISVDENGRPAEYENIILLDIVFIFHDGSEHNKQLLARRDFLYDSANSVAYDREESTILSEMYEELSHRLVSLYLRQLSGKVNP
ncbi:MAG: hypothetical protein GY808_09535 [Gammaproteobacteria bacterium]|nr:hypothetical protein [Gammaproteobacteria bacterium]